MTRTIVWLLLLIAITIVAFIPLSQANFEDARCRCTCPSIEFFTTAKNKTEEDRRYYTKTDISSIDCNTQMVVKPSVLHVVDDARLDAFLANCNCRFEMRNSILLKVVVIFVICVIAGLSAYMGYLLVVEPLWMKRRGDGVGGVRRPAFAPYTRHNSADDMDENIFANPSTPSSVDAPTSDFGSTAAAETNITMQMRTRTNGNATSGGSVGGGGHHPPPAGGIIDRLVDRVVSEQEKWKSSVEEQRRHVLDRQLLN